MQPYRKDTVYLAQDTRLRRKIALKLLPAQFTQDADRVWRFEQEAHAASALNHPNIITIYEIGQVDGAYFIATEFIEGQTLRQQITGAKLTPREMLDVASQIASALSVAHAAGIVHRDIKPENVMRRPDGLVKVFDFGLAKLTERDATSIDAEAPTRAGARTDPGTVMGTVRYMSPEQARGQAVDARTDLFSLGVVTYEMVTGCAPFEGATASDVIASLLNTEPAPLAQHLSEASGEIERIVTKALRKDREERYQTAKDLLVDLRSLKQELESGPRRASAATSRGAEAPPSAEYLVKKLKRHRRGALLSLAGIILAVAGLIYFGQGGEAIESMAILPFAHASADPNMEYLTDGITEGIINTVSQLPNLKVMSRNSVFRYKGRETDAQTAARALGVRAVLTGRVTPQGEELSISVELVDARDNSHLWGETYRRKLSSIFAVQEEISREVSEKLRLRLSGEDQQRLAKRETKNTEAYQLYLKGRYFWNQRNQAGLKKGIEYFQQAIASDPSYAVAYSGLADSYTTLGYFGYLSPKDAFPKAREAAERALELDATLAEPHASLAYAELYYDWDWAEAEKQFRRAITLNPNYATAHHWYSVYLTAMERHREARAEISRAQELDPLSPVISADMGFELYYSGQYDPAIKQLETTLEMNQQFPLAHLWMARAFQQKAMYAEAIAAYQKADAVIRNWVPIVAGIGNVYGLWGKKDEARKVLGQLQELQKEAYVTPYGVALIYAGLGEKEPAFAQLNEAYEHRSHWLVWLKLDPRWEGLRRDPRFADLVRRVGLPQ